MICTITILFLDALSSSYFRYSLRIGFCCRVGVRIGWIESSAGVQLCHFIGSSGSVLSCTIWLFRGLDAIQSRCCLMEWIGPSSNLMYIFCFSCVKIITKTSTDILLTFLFLCLYSKNNRSVISPYCQGWFWYFNCLHNWIKTSLLWCVLYKMLSFFRGNV